MKFGAISVINPALFDRFDDDALSDSDVIVTIFDLFDTVIQSIHIVRKCCQVMKIQK